MSSGMKVNGMKLNSVKIFLLCFPPGFKNNSFFETRLNADLSRVVYDTTETLINVFDVYLLYFDDGI